MVSKLSGMPLSSRDITEAQANFAGKLGFVCTIPGTCLCFLDLVAYGTVSFYPRARQHLNRVSFRLLVYALISNVVYGIAFSTTAAQTGPGTLCTFGAFAVNLTLSLATLFTTCIAINLQLVLVHCVTGRKMEKYYVGGTILLALALTVPTYALDQFGWDEANSTCWFKNSNDHSRLNWLIGTQSLWIALAATVETICSAVVLVWMYRFHTATKSIQDATQVSKWTSIQGAMTTNYTRGMSYNLSTRVISLACKYRYVVLRIMLYPIVSLMVNFSTVALDLNSTIVGTSDEFQYRLLVLDLCLYGFRTATYAVLAILDPGFTKAFREVRRPEIGRRVSNLVFASADLVLDVELEMAIPSDAVGIKEELSVVGGLRGLQNQITGGPDLHTCTYGRQTPLLPQTQIEQESILGTRPVNEPGDQKFEQQL
ncbi:hypothetical protein GYMLUDRAFT_242316 [Collybiopsis luxurians FD-317 M1]|uniref:G-protein coupled receptors family 2 profile 2 domain-containing protein n=1 Tax=Collybiopsis luxurians FD-317 M1 TaxID=944289 RepID=A0A0D0D0V1_9AGAR|nr:hypothetical protein GYMLUDRAFT_242316 [Collybiopsis luxurians FD-317 M1]